MTQSITTKDIPVVSSPVKKVTFEKDSSSQQNCPSSPHENKENPKRIDCESLIREIDSENSKLEALINENVNNSAPTKNPSAVENENIGETSECDEAVLENSREANAYRSKKRKNFIAVVFLCISTVGIITILVVYFVVLKNKTTNPITK